MLAEAVPVAAAPQLLLLLTGTAQTELEQGSSTNSIQRGASLEQERGTRECLGRAAALVSFQGCSSPLWPFVPHQSRSPCEQLHAAEAGGAAGIQPG